MPKDQLASAQRRLSPEEQFCGYQLEARASLEPPNYAYVDYDQIETDSYSFEEYEDFRFLLTGLGDHDDVATLFGYPTGQHDDSEYAAALMLLTGFLLVGCRGASVFHPQRRFARWAF
ncbi:hypothetical protein SB782_06840 [Brevibacillus sp. SIMBA_076]